MSSTNSTTPQASRQIALWVMGLSWANLSALMVVSGLLFLVSENWWLGTVLTYLPRTPYLSPAMGLLVASLFWHRPSIAVNLISVAVVLFPLMGFVIPLNQSDPVESGRKSLQLKIVSCNVQRFRPNFQQVLNEIQAIAPDIIALQEASPVSPLLEEFCRDWHVVHHDNYWVGSRYPVKQIASCDTNAFDRTAGIAVEILTPAGPIVLGDIHQMTARRGLTSLSISSIAIGSGLPELEDFELERDVESIEIREFVDSVRSEKPLLVVGDFNTPTTSVLFQRHWGDLQSAFDVAGFGYGYTSPCKGNRFWPDGLPWVRIDHILCSAEWRISSSQIGKSDGSDHRLITATLRLPAE